MLGLARVHLSVVFRAVCRIPSSKYFRPCARGIARGRTGRRAATALLLAASFLPAARVWAQDPGVNGLGLGPQHGSFSLVPWERIDPFTGNALLTFGIREPRRMSLTADSACPRAYKTPVTSVISRARRPTVATRRSRMPRTRPTRRVPSPSTASRRR